MIDETSAEITVVVSNQQTQTRTKLDLLKRAIELREWTLVWALRSLFAKPVPLSEDVSLNDCEYVSDAKRIKCVPETVDGWKNEIPSKIVDIVADDADIAVRFGFGFVVGDILTELEYGVLSYHHGDIREYRGQPAGCWEFIHGEDEVGITLQRINERLDAGEVAAMKTISIQDSNTYSEIRGRLYENSEGMLTEALLKLESGKMNFEVADTLGRLYTIPKGFSALRFFCKELRGHCFNKSYNQPSII